MSYRVRFTTQTGATGYWEGTFATRAGATHSAQSRADITGYTYAVEEVPEPGSTAAHHVEILRERLKELEALVDERGKAVTDAHVANHVMHVRLSRAIELGDAMHRAVTTAQSRFYVDWGEIRVALAEWTAYKESLVANHAMHQDLSFAIQLGDAMREAMRTGEWRPGHDRSMASSAIAGWDRWKTSLAKAPSVPVGASEVPGEGGDSDRRRLEALERYLEGDTFRKILKTSMGPFAAGTKFEGQHFDAPTLAALADKLMEKEAKP